MSAYRLVTLRCDGLLDHGFRTCPWELHGDRASDLRREARSKGWLVSEPGGKDFCPRHKHQERRDLKTVSDTRSPAPTPEGTQP